MVSSISLHDFRVAYGAYDKCVISNTGHKPICYHQIGAFAGSTYKGKYHLNNLRGVLDLKVKVNSLSWLLDHCVNLGKLLQKLLLRHTW